MRNIQTLYNLFVRDFRNQKKRITLTLIALAWGTISIMLLLGFGEGLHQQLTINRKGMGDAISIIWGGETSIAYKGLGKGRPIRLHREDVPYLKERIPQIQYIGGEYHRWGAMVKYDSLIVSEHVTGITPDWEVMRNHIPMMGGRMINDEDMKKKRRVAFLGYSIYESLFGDGDAIGESILINNIPFTVVGVMVDKMQMNSYSGRDTRNICIPATTFYAIFGDPYLDNIVYQPYDASEMKSIEKQIFEAMGARYRFDPEDDRALWVWDVAESSREFNKILVGLKIFLGIIGGLTLLIAGVGVANIMYVSIKERSREIGIKMALGARRSYILFQFLLEAIMITFTGGMIGMALSYVLTEGFKRVPIESEVLDFMGRPTISFEIGAIVIAILGLMGILSGFFPALRASSVNPVETLRYE
jgi:putative ABC transport system permease protein